MAFLKAETSSRVTLVGRKDCPGWAVAWAREFGYHLAEQGVPGDSGSAAGMDQAWEQGYYDFMDLSGAKRLFRSWLPYNGFNKRYANGCEFLVLSERQKEMAYQMLEVSGLIPDIRTAVDWYQRYMLRNVYQLMSMEWRKSQACIYWHSKTNIDEQTGGTAVTVKLARYLGIPTYNLQSAEERKALCERFNYDDHIKVTPA